MRSRRATSTDWKARTGEFNTRRGLPRAPARTARWTWRRRVGHLDCHSRPISQVAHSAPSLPGAATVHLPRSTVTGRLVQRIVPLDLPRSCILRLRRRPLRRPSIVPCLPRSHDPVVSESCPSAVLERLVNPVAPPPRSGQITSMANRTSSSRGHPSRIGVLNPPRTTSRRSPHRPQCHPAGHDLCVDGSATDLSSTAF